MTVAHLDTSAAMKLVIEETESEALVAALTDSSRRLAASWLLHTELHCAAGRHPAIIAIDAITAVLDAVSLVDMGWGAARCRHSCSAAFERRDTPYDRIEDRCGRARHLR